MIDIFKVFYTYHYNVAAISLLLLLLVIFLLTKKNFKWSLIFLAIVAVLNVFIWQRTAGKQWTVTETPEEDPNSWYASQPKTYTFSAPDHWTEKTDSGEELHWCWVETYKDKFLTINFVDKLWGSKEAKKLRSASEERLSQ